MSHHAGLGAIFSAILFIGLQGLQTPCLAQSSGAAGSIHEASFKAGLGRWTDAIEQYQRIIETAGDELVPVPVPVSSLAMLTGSTALTKAWSSPRSLPARWICHQQMGSLPAAALKLYRDRNDASAFKRFEELKSRPDDRLLRQFLGEWFNTTAGEDAILLLAERAFERGDFATATRYRRMLLPDATGDLRYPVARTPRADTEARLLELRLFQGETEPVRRELASYRERFPNATGRLAGRDGSFADTLDSLVRNAHSLALPPAPDDGNLWTTFGGWPSRDSRITHGLPRHWPGPATWKTEIPAQPEGKIRGDDQPFAPDQARSLAFHPVIAKGRAFVADALHVYAVDLLTGELRMIFDLRRSLPVPGIDGRLPVRGDLRYTLTYADGFLYVRLGAQSLRLPRDENPDGANESSSVVVCLGPISDNKAAVIPHAWTLRPPKLEKESTSIFEGSPLVVDGRLFTVVWRQTGGQTTTAIACYRIPSLAELPERLWLREVGKPAFNPTGDMRARHDLLTLAGSNIVFATNAGNIIALDARSGLPAWEYRYRGTEQRSFANGRDLCPCLFDGEHIFAAPADSDQLLCLDAATGPLRWERDGVDVVQLLGVTRGRLIATFSGSIRGIRGMDVRSGAERLPDGWTQHDDGGVATFGRGFVTPDLVYWPTKHGLQFLNPEDGNPARQPIPGMFGNLAYAEGCFVMTNATEVHGFVTGVRFDMLGGRGSWQPPRRPE